MWMENLWLLLAVKATRNALIYIDRLWYILFPIQFLKLRNSIKF